jgi:exosortase A
MSADPTTLKSSATEAAIASAWRRFLPALVVLLAAILLLYRETAIAIVQIWSRSETFTHGFLVPPIVLWLIWRQRAELARLVPAPSAWGLIPMAAAGVLWLLGDLAAVNAATQLALATLLVSAVPCLLGWQVTRAIMFPLGFLFFGVPLGEFLMPQLMEWTANFTVLALRASGIPVYREGLNFVIPSGSWSVVEACSGVRYLIASLTVGTLFAYLNYRSPKRRWIFVGVSLLVPVVANWLRAYLIVMLGHLSGNKLAAGVDHLIYGWLFFGVVILVMFMIGARWAEPDAPASPAGPAARPSAALVGSAGWTIVLLAALFAGAPHGVEWALDKADSKAAVHLVPPQTLAGGWQLSPQPAADWQPAFQNPSAQMNVTYTRDGQTVGLYVGYYRNQTYERKLVSSENSLVKPKDSVWTLTSGSQRSVAPPAQGLPALRAAELRARSAIMAPTAGEGLTVWQVYWLDGHLTASDQMAKIHSALNRLLGRGDESAVVILYANQEQPGGAEPALRAFASGNLAAIDTWLKQTKTAL